jgi:hypothetical protein
MLFDTNLYRAQRPQSFRFRLAATISLGVSCACVCGIILFVASATTKSLGAAQGSKGTGSGPQPMPPQYHFPTPTATVDGWIAQSDLASIRTHGWELWAGINSPTSQTGSDGMVLPVWRTWWTQDQVLAGPPSIRALGVQAPGVRFERPKQFGHRGVKLQSSMTGAGDVTFTGVAVTVNVDDEYAKFVWAPHPGPDGATYSYYRTDSLTRLNGAWPAPTPTANRKIEDFPPAAVSLKPTFQLVKAKQNANDTNTFRGLTVLPVWDGDLETGVLNTYNPAAPDPSQWKRCVLVAPTGADQRAGSELNGIPCNAHTIDNVPVVPISAFYAFALTSQEAASFNQVFSGNPAQQGDYAVLVAMHMSTKEIANWTWQTFWWANGVHKYGAPPATLQAPWSNYEMQTAYFMTLPPNDPNGKNQLTYNPYLEAGGVTDGIHSNCMSCHTTARFAVSMNGSVDGQGYPCGYTKPNNYIAPGHGDDDKAYFAGQTTADFSWLIGTIPPPVGNSQPCAAGPAIKSKLLHEK